MGEGKIIDFRKSSNPFGVSQEIRQAARAAADLCDMLPKDMEEDLAGAIAARTGIPAQHICCGGGTTGMVYRIIFAFRPRRALVPVPAWPLYETALKQYGCQVEECVLPEHDDFRLGARLRDMIRSGGYDLLFLANPADPSGALTDKAFLADLIYVCGKAGTRLVVDECFMDFVLGQEKYTLLQEVSGMSGVIVLKSFSASYCMSGLRLGYAVCGSASDARVIREGTEDRSISAPAYRAGLAALTGGDIRDEDRVYIAMEREKLTSGLLKAGLQVYSSQANFLLMKSPWDLGAHMDALGIRLSEVTGSPGLDGIPGYFYRACVRDRESNRYLVDSLTHVMRALRQAARRKEEA